jgi:hypothetical protein
MVGIRHDSRNARTESGQPHYLPYIVTCIILTDQADMEKENEALSTRMDSDIAGFRQRLADAEGVNVDSVMVPA